MEAVRSATQLSTSILPIAKATPAVTTGKITSSKIHAYMALRNAQSEKKYRGIREERAKAKAEAEAAKKKK